MASDRQSFCCCQKSFELLHKLSAPRHHLNSLKALQHYGTPRFLPCVLDYTCYRLNCNCLSRAP